MQFGVAILATLLALPMTVNAAAPAHSRDPQCAIADGQALISGSVVWLDSGEPVSHARVSVMYAGTRYYAWSDNRGIWSVAAPSAGVGSEVREEKTALVRDPGTGDMVRASATQSSAICHRAVVSVGAPESVR